MADYAFVTRWSFQAPIDQVWTLISESERWAWMNLLAPVARPFFAWNHDVVMRWGGEGLARRLECSAEGARCLNSDWRPTS